MLESIVLVLHLTIATFSVDACSDCGRVQIPPLDPADEGGTWCQLCIYDFGNSMECINIGGCGCGSFFPNGCDL